MSLTLRNDTKDIECRLYQYDIKIIHYLGLQNKSVDIKKDLTKTLRNKNESNKIIYKNLHNVIIVLKSNETYRFGDVINNNLHLINSIIQSPSNYKGSLLYEYILRLKSENLLRFCKKKKKFTILKSSNMKMRYQSLARSCIKFKRKEIPSHDSLVVHVRTGDIIGNKTHTYYMEAVEVYNLINNYIKNNQKANIQRIELVTALHYGVAHEGITHYRTNLNKKEHPFAYTSESERLNHVYIQEIVNNCKLPVLIKSEENIDNSFMFMVYAKHFINTKGQFSRCLRNVNSIIKEFTMAEENENSLINNCV